MGFNLQEGELIAGRYRLERLLGKGGMGFVWAATHAVTRRSVAIKLLLGPLSARPEMRRRFLREARAAAAVEHPNVVEIYDVFELADETPVMVMSLLRGETLGARLNREGRLPFLTAVNLVLPVVSAVGTAHALGIVHRDLKPENVFLAREGSLEVVKVLDFGIAKLASDELGDHGTITGPGTMLGTPCYMAPEQAFGERDVDHRADVWSIAIMLYEALAGERPVEGDNLGQVLKRIMTHGILPIQTHQPDLPPEICSLLARMLSYERTDRPSDLREVYATLGAFATVTAPPFDPASPMMLRDSGRAEAATRISGRPESSRPSHEAEQRLAAVTVDPVAPTEQIGQPETPAAHAISIINRRPRPGAVLSLVAGGAAAGLLLWRLTATQPEDAAAPSAQSLDELANESASAAPPPLPAQSAELKATPNPTLDAGAEAAVEAAPSNASLRAPRTPVRSHVRPERPDRASLAAPASAVASAPAPLPASAPANTPPPSAAEGLHEEPPF